MWVNYWDRVCSQQASLFSHCVLLELTGPVKTETFCCPQFTFPALVCQQKGTRFLDSFNNSLSWPFAFSSRQPPPPSALSSVGRYRGPVRVWNSPPPRLEGEKVPQTELLIQSGEQYAQLGTHKGPEWVQGPCWGQAAQSPWGINCGWQCVNSGVNRQRRCGTPQARLNSPFHTLGSLLPLSLLLSYCIKKKFLTSLINVGNNLAMRAYLFVAVCFRHKACSYISFSVCLCVSLKRVIRGQVAAVQSCQPAGSSFSGASENCGQYM